MSDKLSVHIDLADQHLDIPEVGPSKCPDCKVEVESGFGLAGGGYGCYEYCPKCGKVTSKIQVHE